MEGDERTVWVTYSPETNMGYLSLADIYPGGVERTEPLIVQTAAGVRLINLDFDGSGQLVGIEFDGARGSMPHRLIAGV